MLESVAEKLGVIAENTPKVYEAGYNAAIDKFCPDFSVSGSAVSCTPIDGYPLKVVSTLPESDTGYTNISFKQYGKNIFDPVAYSVPVKGGGVVSLDGDVFTCNFTVGNVYININSHASRVITPPGTYTISFVPVNASTFGLTVILYRASDRSQISFRQFATARTTYTFTVNEPFIVSIAGLTSAHTGLLSFKVQLEVGSVATEYEAYKKPSSPLVSVRNPFPGGTFDWSTGKLTTTSGAVQTLPIVPIVGNAGVNTFIADTGTIEVSGKADPRAYIKEATADA